MVRWFLKYGMVCLGLGIALTGWGQELPLPPQNVDMVGSLHLAVVGRGEDFEAVAHRNDVGYFELAAANPVVDPDHLKPGTTLIIPALYVLPRVEREGVVINLSAMRLFYFPPGSSHFYTYPIGIGREDWATPLGVLSIIEKMRNPVWVVPDSIYQYRKANGDPVPHMVPSGPDNPLGYYALRLSKPTFLIHDTNDSKSVGVRSSAGCIHLYPEDIKALFNFVRVGTPVHIVNEPYLVGKDVNGAWWMQAYLPLQEDRERFMPSMAQAAMVWSKTESTTQPSMEALDKILTLLKEHTGIAEDVPLNP